MQKTKENPIITVVIPAWNLNQELVDCVRSIQEQSEPSRIVIVDNASDTPLPEIAKVDYIRLPRRVSIGEARNVGMEGTDTPFIYFMDADDQMLPDNLKILLDELQANANTVVASGAIIKWNPHTGHRVPNTTWPPPHAYALQHKPLRFSLKNATKMILPVAGSALIRTQAAKRTGGFPDLNYGEDWVFSVALSFQGGVRLSKHAGKLYRLDPEHNSLASTAMTDRQVENRWQAQKKIRSTLRHAPNVPWFVRLISPFYAPVHAYYTLRSRHHQRDWV